MTELKKVLETKNADALRYICWFFEIKNVKALKKKELIELLNDYLSKKDTLDRIFTFLNDEEIAAVIRVGSGKPFPVSDTESALFFADALGYVSIKGDILISDTIFDYLSESHPELEEKRKQFNLLDDYFTACANLYGVAPADIAVEQYNKNERKALQKEQLKEISRVANAKCSQYSISEDTLINNDVLFLGEDYIDELIEAQTDKPFKILPKDDLLNYVDCDHVEKTPQYNRMVTMLSLVSGLDRFRAIAVTEQLAHMAKAQMDFDSIFEALDEMDVAFADVKELNKFMEAYTDLWNNTRLWENCGHTPTELRKLYEQR